MAPPCPPEAPPARPPRCRPPRPPPLAPCPPPPCLPAPPPPCLACPPPPCLAPCPPPPCLPPCPPPPCLPPWPPPPCPPPPPFASASSVIRGTTRSSIAAMQAPVVNTGLTALRDWARCTPAVCWALAYLHALSASITDIGALLQSPARRCLIYRNSVSCQAVPACPLRPRTADLAAAQEAPAGALGRLAAQLRGCVFSTMDCR